MDANEEKRESLLMFTKMLIQQNVPKKSVPKVKSRALKALKVAQKTAKTAIINFPTTINFNAYLTVQQMNAYIDSLVAQFPDRISIQKVYRSHEQRLIKLVKISNGYGNQENNAIVVDAGMHGREWITPATALYIIFKLVEEFVENKDLLLNFDWYILPVINPDGYDWSLKQFRMWRKTRTQVSTICKGVDMNRNFSYSWETSDWYSSHDPCSQTYKGTRAFSEVESCALQEVLLSLKGRGKFYLSLHSYGCYILYPWGCRKFYAPNHTELDKVAAAGVKAILNAKGLRYTYGAIARTLYPVSGSSIDYAYATAEFPICICMELADKGYEFHPPQKLIKDLVQESWIGIRAMAETVIAMYPAQIVE